MGKRYAAQPVELDSSGKIIGMVIEPGGALAEFRAPLSSGASRIMLLGTSISNQVFGGVAPIDENGRIDLNPSYGAILNAVLGNPFNLMLDSAVSGDTVAQMRARFKSDVQARYSEFDVLLIEPGPNSAHAAVAAVSVIDDLDFMVNDAVENGKLIVLATPTTSNQMDNGAKLTSQSEVEDWCRNKASSTDGVVLADFASVFASPVDGFPESPAQTALSDRVHPGHGGHCTLGKEAARALKNFITPTRRGSFNRYSHTEYLPNPLMAGGYASGVRGLQFGAGVTGTGPEATSIEIIGGTFSSVVASTGYDSRGRPGLRLVAAGASAAWAGLRVRCGSQLTPSQIGRWDQTWTASTVQTIGDHRRLSGDTLGILTCIGLVSGNTGTTGETAPAVPGAFGTRITDGGVIWKYQKLPAAGDKFVGEMIYEVSRAAPTDGLVMQLTAGLSRDGNWTAATAGGYVDSERFGISTWNRTDTSGTVGIPSRYWPEAATLRTPEVTLRDPGGGANLRHVGLELLIYTSSGGGFDLLIPEASLVRTA